jgi:metallo-beta-lactamase family protein
MGVDKDRNKNKVRLEFLGGNASFVTGSAILGTFNNTNFLLELGMVQGYSELENYRANWDILNRIDFKKIDYIFINHFHCDHSGLIPHATSNGFTGKIIGTYETSRMLKPLWEDSAHIIKDTCEWLRNTKGIRAVEYYKDIHVPKTFDYVYEYSLNEIHKLTDDISFKLLPTNHVLGSCSIEIYFKDYLNKTHTLFYSSDLGNTTVDKFFVYEDIQYSKKANLAIFESTYGGNRKNPITPKMRKNDIREMKNQILYTILENQGNVLFPSFACDRQENLLVYIKQIIESDERLKDVQVYVDGKLSAKVVKVYADVLKDDQKELFDDILNWENLHVYSSYDQSKLVLSDKTPKIVFSSSGMCEAGRVKEYLKRYLPNKNNTIIFTGFAPENSIGEKIKSHEHDTVTIDKVAYQIKAKVVDLHSFSSHMQQQSLLDYMASMNCSDGFVLVHGEKEDKEILSEKLKERLLNQNKTTPVIVSKKGMVLYF